MAKYKEDVSIEQLKDTLKYAEECKDIQYQILDYCAKLTNRKEAINKMEIVEDLRAIVMWDEEEKMIDKETTSRLLVEMIVQGAPDTELALVIEYSKLILDADIMYKKQIHQIVNKYATDSKEEK